MSCSAVPVAWVTWKSIEGLPGSPSVVGGSPSLGLKLLRLAAASISVPSTVKCSSENSPRSWARPDHLVEELLPDLVREQALAAFGEEVKTVASKHAFGLRSGYHHDTRRRGASGRSPHRIAQPGEEFFDDDARERRRSVAAWTGVQCEMGHAR